MKIREIHTNNMPPTLTPKATAKPMTQEVPEQAPPTSTPPKCLAIEQPDGRIEVRFLIEPDVANKLRKRAGPMDMAKYLWENIINRSVVDHVY